LELFDKAMKERGITVKSYCAKEATRILSALKVQAEILQTLADPWLVSEENRRNIVTYVSDLPMNGMRRRTWPTLYNSVIYEGGP
jgi:hypothetical protein